MSIERKEDTNSPSETQLHPRRATLDDIPSVAALHRLAFFHTMPHMPVLHTPDEDLVFYSTVVFPKSQVWLCEHVGTITGFIAFRPGWVDHLYVHPDHQRRGIGGRLLALAQCGEPSLRLWTFQCNALARSFYEQHGFRMERETDGADNEERQPDVLYAWLRNGSSEQEITQSLATSAPPIPPSRRPAG